MAGSNRSRGVDLEKSNSAIEQAQEIQDRSIQELALEYAPSAIETLGTFARGKKVGKIAPTPQVVRAASRDIIEFAGGRPETRDPRIGDGSQNLTIILERKTDGTTRRMEQAVNDVVDATFREAEQLVEATTPTRRPVKKTFFVPDDEEIDFQFEDD